jgi:hypothetical protein
MKFLDDYGFHGIFIQYFERPHWEDKQIIHVDNKGNAIFVNPDTQTFLINDTNAWNSFMAHHIENFDWDHTDNIFKFGQGTIVIKKDSVIKILKYDDRKIVSSNIIKHKAVDIEFQCDLYYIMVPKNPRYLIFFYDLSGAITVIVWDLEVDIEHANFLSKKEDNFIDYITGKNSKLGFVCFDKYIVDLDICIPIPFMSMKYKPSERFWGQGVKINTTEDVILGNGTIITPMCYKDIYFYKNKSLANLDEQKIVYYMNKKSVAFDYIDDYDSLKKVLEIFEDNPLYYVMLVLEDNSGKSPLQLAIENNSARIIELMLNCLMKLDHFSLSRKIYLDFPTLFKMNLRSFEKYLNSCYFITEQMRSINKLDLPEAQDTIREHFTCSILDIEFYKKYGVPDKNGNAYGKEDSKVNKNQVAPSERPGSKAIDRPGSNALERSQSMADQGDESDGEVTNVFEDDENLLKRVSIKGIEFDWIFTGDKALELLKNLSDSEVHIFGQSIIKDIVLFQWKYFKRVIILKLFLPYVIYFVLFCMYTTWLLERRFTEISEDGKDGGKYDITCYAIGSIILLFNVFWAYVELRQILFHGLDYLMEFWNMLDLFTVFMNTTVVIMNFADASFENTNRVAAISVLVLYFKLFYFLRIFFATAYLVRMIIEIIKDMQFFVGVLMIATIAFGNAFYILGRNSEGENLAGDNVIDAFIFSYKMGLGDFITDGFGTRDEEILWIFFLLNSLIILIVLLNLVIAIMGDTFDRVQETQENSMLKELTNMIRENEFLFSRSRAFKKAKYIVVIEPETAEGGGNVSWEGKLNQLKTFIEESSEKHILHLKKLQDEVETIGKFSPFISIILKPIFVSIFSKF